jgi:hypothetical protein
MDGSEEEGEGGMRGNSSSQYINMKNIRGGKVEGRRNTNLLPDIRKI